MTLFNKKPGGFLARAQEWMTPERGIAMQGLGLGIQQLANNRPVDLSYAHNALAQRQARAQSRQALQDSGILQKFTPEQQQLLASMEPAAAQKIIAAAMFAPPPAPTKGIPVGGNIVNPITGDVIYEGPQGRDIRNDVNGRPRYTDTGEAVYPDVTPDEPNALVEIHNNSQSKYREERAKSAAAQMASIEESAQAADRALTALDLMEQTIADEGFYSGAAGEQALLLKRIGRNLGFDADGIDSIETFNAQSKAAALDVMGGSLGTGFSNADRDFVMDQVPNLGNTPEGNQMLIAVQRRIQQRKKDILSLATAYERENDTLVGFSAELAKWAEENPVFEDNFLSQTATASTALPLALDYPSSFADDMKAYGITDPDAIAEGWRGLSDADRQVYGAGNE